DLSGRVARRPGTVEDGAGWVGHVRGAEFMREISCPSCRDTMGIEETEPDTEWECPTCATVLRVFHDARGSLQLAIIETPPPPTDHSESSESRKDFFGSKRLNEIAWAWSDASQTDHQIVALWFEADSPPDMLTPKKYYGFHLAI